MANLSISLLQVLISALVALLVVALTHGLTSYRDRQNQRSAQRIDYLISAYHAFTKVSNNPRLYEVAEEVEQAVADVQIFGSPEQVRLVRQFAADLSSAGGASLNDLLIELRDSLRKELKAEPLASKHIWLRIYRPGDPADDDKQQAKA